MAILKIRDDFSPFPGARYYTDGPRSGQEFYETCLKRAFQDALDKREKLTVDLDHTAGFGSSFLSESFGRLVEDFGKNTIQRNILIISNVEPDWKDRILNEYIPNALNRKPSAAI